jgi:hypothetical protein
VQKESLDDLAKGRHDTQLRPPGESGEREIPGGHIRGNTLRVGVGNLPGMSEPSLSSITIYQLRVVLCGVSPLVWRRLLMANDTTIAGLHEILQSAFDWGGEHLHCFHIHGAAYGVRCLGGMVF